MGKVCSEYGCGYTGHNFSDHEVVTVTYSDVARYDIAICPNEIYKTRFGWFYKLTQFNQSYIESENTTLKSGLIYTRDGYSWKFISDYFDVERIFNEEKLTVLSMLDASPFTKEQIYAFERNKKNTR